MAQNASQRPQTAAAMREEDYSVDAALAAEEFDARLYVERKLLEIDRHFVVLVARIHAEHEEAAPGEFRAFGGGEFVSGAMDGEHAHARGRVIVREIEQGFRASGKRGVKRIALRHCRGGSE